MGSAMGSGGKALAWGGGSLLILCALAIGRAAVTPAPTLADLVEVRGAVASVEYETVPAAKGSRRLLCVRVEGGDGTGDALYLHPDSGRGDALVRGLEIGADVVAHAEPHARQILRGTPLARGRTELWRVARVDADDQEVVLLPFEEARAQRQKDRVSWGAAGLATLLVGGFGIAQARRASARG